jgi:hypothetical protein
MQHPRQCSAQGHGLHTVPDPVTSDYVAYSTLGEKYISKERTNA